MPQINSGWGNKRQNKMKWKTKMAQLTRPTTDRAQKKNKMSYCHWRGRSSCNKVVLVVSAPGRCRSAILRNFLIGWNVSIRFINIGSFASSHTNTQRRINVSLNVFFRRSFEFSCVKCQILRSNYTLTHQQVNLIVQAVSRTDVWNDSISNIPKVPIKIFTPQTSSRKSCRSLLLLVI